MSVMLTDASTIPVVSPDVEIVRFDKTTYLVSQRLYNYQLRISSHLYQILSLIDGQRTISEIRQELIGESYMIEEATLCKLLCTGRLVECGIIKSERLIEPRISNNYLKLRVTLLKARYILPLTKLFKFLFTPTYFCISGGVMLVLLGWSFLHFINFSSFSKFATNSINAIGISSVYCLFYFSTFLHELGHASACKRFGAMPGDIGFGFYLIMPVFYADVSDAWRVPAPKRVIIDLAGLYMEILLCTILVSIFLFTNATSFLYVSVVLLLRTYGNLNPFLRMDGYWALADSVGMPNLRQDSIKQLINCWNWLRKRAPFPFYKRSNILLFMYAACSQLMVIFLLGILLMYNSQSIFYLPTQIWSFVYAIVFSYSDITYAWLVKSIIGFFPSILFYLLLANLLIRYSKKLFDRRYALRVA